MKSSLIYSFLICLLGVTLLTGCQGFLEDYNYAPVGSTSSSY